MAAAMVTKAQLEARIGATLLQRVADDNGDGQGDNSVIAQILAEASDFVRGGIPQHDPDDLTPANALITGELRRLALDAAEYICAKRRPTILKRDWVELKKSVMDDLELLRKAQRSLGSNASPAPADHSVSVASGAPRDPYDYWP